MYGFDLNGFNKNGYDMYGFEDLIKMVMICIIKNQEKA